MNLIFYALNKKIRASGWLVRIRQEGKGNEASLSLVVEFAEFTLDGQ